jgi:chromosome segregation ATPase
MLGSPFMTPIRHDIPAIHGPFSPDEALAEAQERIRGLEHYFVGLHRDIEQLKFQMEGKESRFAALEHHIGNLSQRLANLTVYVAEFVNRMWNQAPGTA